MSKWERQIKLFCKNNSFEKYESTISKLFIQETENRIGRRPVDNDTISTNFPWDLTEQGTNFWMSVDWGLELIDFQGESFKETLLRYYSEKLDVFELES